SGCLRFAGVVAHPPRKTRFRLLVRLYRTGLVTRRLPSERFQASDYPPFPSFLGARPVLLEDWWGGSVSLSELSTSPSHLSPAVHPETVSMRPRGSRAIRREPQDTRRSDERAGGVESPHPAP